MNREDELFARVVAQQQQITALHTELVALRATHAATLDAATIARIDAALTASESLGRVKFEDAVAEAIEPRVALHKAEIEAKHADELKQRDDQINFMSRGIGPGAEPDQPAKGK